MNDDDLLTKRTEDLFRIWNRERNKKVFDIIDTIANDCLAQSECIKDEKEEIKMKKEREYIIKLIEEMDAPWCCHDKDNWDSIVEQLDKIKLILIKGN